MRTFRLTQLAVLVSGLACVPAASAHPGHVHDPGWLAGLLHSVTGWDQLLILLAVAAVGIYYLIDVNRSR